MEINETKPLTHSEEIADSFEVSGGDLNVHALYIRGISMAKNIPITVAGDTLAESWANLDSSSQRFVIVRMAKGHRGNPSALRALREIKQDKREVDIIQSLAYQLPDNIEVEYLNRPIEKMNQGIKMDKVDEALRRIFKGEVSPESRKQSVKYLAAHLKFYQNMDWWKNMEAQEKSKWIKLGNELLSTSS